MLWLAINYSYKSHLKFYFDAAKSKEGLLSEYYLTYTS